MCVGVWETSEAEEAAPLTGRGFESAERDTPAIAEERQTVANCGSKAFEPVLASFSVFAMAMK